MLVNGTVTREALVTQGTRIQLGDASGPALGLTPVVSGSAPQAATSTVSAVRHPAAQGMGPAARPSQPTGALRKLAKVFFWFAAILGIVVMLGLGFVLLNYGRYLF